jgi:NAD(P)-dependent dehydrogenase (short-subunit alcohol dehydrogenase family)
MPQRVLITAGAAGIGREFARAFATSGAGVFVCDIDSGALETTAKEIPGLIVRPCELARRAEIARMLREAVARLGGLDVLINNAGMVMAGLWPGRPASPGSASHIVRDCRDKPGNDG